MSNELVQLDHIFHQFGLSTTPAALPGGTTTTYRVGDVVLKRIKETSLENNHSPELIQWIADFSTSLPQAGFRIPKPIATVEHMWITSDGWTAWTFLQGGHATIADIPACIEAITAFHTALKPIPMHPLMTDNRTPWGKAHQWCWGNQPHRLQPQLRYLVDRLYAI